jgi:LysR family transcriptional regulator for metE and metH
MDVEFRHLKLVTTVAEVGSLTRAGQRLHLTQSALSHQLRDIESRLGTPLFLRGGKRMAITAAGQRLLQSARTVLSEMEQAEGEIRQFATERKGLIRLTTECYTCYHWLPPLLKIFEQQYPGVEVRIDVEATTRPIRTLLEGTIDLALVSATQRDPRLSFTPVFKDELLLIMAPGHRLTASKFVRLADLKEETVIVYTPREESHFLRDVLLPAGIVPARVQPVQLTEAIIEMVKAGLGVSALARWAVQPHLKAATLEARRITSGGLMRQWIAVMPKGLARVGFMQAFVQLIARHAPSRPTRGGRN